MSTLVFLDTGPLGMVTNPRATPQTERCTHWMEGLLTRGVRVLIPEIADYELRRELLRAEKIEGLRRLDAMVEALEYLPTNDGHDAPGRCLLGGDPEAGPSNG
jgi:predicted nucleic acid-binding protein